MKYSIIEIAALLLFFANQSFQVVAFISSWVAPTTAVYRRRRRIRLWSASFAASDSSSESSSLQSTQSNLRHISLEKPLGLVLEETGGGGSADGTQIIDMEPGGNAAVASQRGDADVCIGDEIIAVNGNSASCGTLEQVMECIAKSDNPVVRLTLQRPPGTVAVKFQNGVAIAALPGTHLCNLALEAHVKIEFSCRNGACGTCEQLMIVPTSTSSGNKACSSRYVRPCVATVPSGADNIRIVPSDRYAP